MSYNRKITEYALLPNGAFPLDARSHFKSLAEAYKTVIPAEVSTVENAHLNENEGKHFYVGEIITTTIDGTWQVIGPVRNNVDIYFGKNAFTDVRWGSTTSASRITSLHVIQKDGNYYLCSSDNEIISKLNNVASYNTNYFKSILDTNLVPFSGSGGGGGATLSLIAQEPLNYDSSTSTLSLTYDTNVLKVDNQALTLKIDNNSPLTLTDSGLSLKIDTTSGHGGLTISENGLSLKLAKDSNLSINNKGELDLKLNIIGTHTTIEKTGSVDTIKLNNYIYQEI